jgi:hypothetical protein
MTTGQATLEHYQTWYLKVILKSDTLPRHYGLSTAATLTHM